MLIQKLARFRVVIILGTFILINLFFNSEFVFEILDHNQDQYRIFGGDERSYQYFTESFYQNLKQGKNPFAYNDSLLYPLGVSTSLQDVGPIQTIYFLLFRPFLTIHNSLLLGTMISLFVCEIVMYLLLRQLKFSTVISLLFSLVFSFSPFVSMRIYGQFPYMYHFFFPLLILLLLKFKESTKLKMHLFYSTLVGISLACLFYANLYYSVMFFLLVIAYSFFEIVLNGTLHFKKYLDKKTAGYVVIAILSFLITISPLAITIPQSLRNFSSFDDSFGAYTYSAYLVSFFTPTSQNPFYQILFGYPKSFPFYQAATPTEGSVYLGVITILGVLLFSLYYRRTFLKQTPLLLTAITFFILCLGPIVRVTNTIQFNIPLLYKLFEGVPLLSSLRSPVRFITPLSFCLTILSAYGFSIFLKQKRHIYILYFFIFAIFIIDQTYYVPQKATNLNLPLSSYHIIQKQPGNGTVMELPFVIQDGHLYWGAVHNTQFEIGQLIHQKPVIGGFLGRLEDSSFLYYLNNELLQYYGFIYGGSDSPIINYYLQSKPNSLSNLKVSGSQITINKPSPQVLDASIKMLNIHYILLNKQFPQYLDSQQDFLKIGFSIVNTDDAGFVFLRRD